MSIFDEAIRLKPGDRAKLVDALLSSLDSPDKEIDLLWVAEAESRIEAYEQGTTNRVRSFDGPVFRGRFRSELLTREAHLSYVLLGSLCCVCRMTGASLAELWTARMGPRANPERRFAAWAPAHRTDLTRREIGVLLHMTTQQVHNVVNRWSEKKDARLARWREALDEEGSEPKLSDK